MTRLGHPETSGPSKSLSAVQCFRVSQGLGPGPDPTPPSDSPQVEPGLLEGLGEGRSLVPPPPARWRLMDRMQCVLSGAAQSSGPGRALIRTSSPPSRSSVYNLEKGTGSRWGSQLRDSRAPGAGTGLCSQWEGGRTASETSSALTPKWRPKGLRAERWGHHLQVPGRQGWGAGPWDPRPGLLPRGGVPPQSQEGLRAAPGCRPLCWVEVLPTASCCVPPPRTLPPCCSSAPVLREVCFVVTPASGALTDGPLGSDGVQL